jgi:hypothetical protein
MRGMRSQWFNSACIDLLRCYCATAMLCDRQAEKLRTLSIDDPQHTKTLRALNHTSKTLATLATRLRITRHGDGELYRQALAVQRPMLQGYDDLPPAA